jgi:hypothetical protein
MWSSTYARVSVAYTISKTVMNKIRAFGLVLLAFFFSNIALAEGTSLWRQSRYDDFEKGTARGVAISSDGHLELAPSFKSIFTSPSTYIWQVVSDAQGNAYLASGSPARVYRVTPEGKASIIFEAKELQVQALEIDDQGSLYAATSPDGKVYKISRTNAKGQAVTNSERNESASTTSSEAATKSEVPVDKSYEYRVFFDPKTKYIWDLTLDRSSGRLYIATGDHGEIFKVEKDGQGSLFFKSDESHIRCLALQPVVKSLGSEEPATNKRKKANVTTPVAAPANVIAGTDGSGLIYRISAAGEAFVLYSASKKEITALAVDNAGTIYAAGVGEKRAPGGPGPAPLPLSLPQNPPPAASGTAPAPQIASIPSAPVASGAEIYTIAPEGAPKRIWNSRDDIVYALALSGNSLLIGTGNRGHIYSIARDGHFGTYTDLLKASANQIASFARTSNGFYAATSNLGKLFLIGSNPEAEGTFESDVFDAKIFSRWGHPEVRGTGNFDFYARSGNVDNPDRNWSPWNKVDLTKDVGIGVPDARFMQWKVSLRPGNSPATLSSVGINYRSENVAPVIDDISVQVGARFGASGKAGETVVVGFANNPSAPPVSATKDRDYIAVRWTTHDDNDDDLVYSVYYRGDAEKNWKLLKDNVHEKQYSWDASLLPDGGYTVKIVASDAPSHTPDEALADERESTRFEVDSTPPRIETLLAKVEGQELHVTFRASDNFSPIRRAEYSVDAGDWQLIEPIGLLSDSRAENYDFNVLLAGANAAAEAEQNSRTKSRAQDKSEKKGGNGSGDPNGIASHGEHVVVVRVYDRFDNMSSAKTVIPAAAAPVK